MPKPKGTNSLAFARTDCHTCVSSRRKCDRRRPQCTTCLDQGLKCGGFATPLSWDDSRIFLGKPSQKAVYACDGDRSKGRGRGESAKSSRNFRFVGGGSKRKRRRRVSPDRSLRGEQTAATESPQEAEVGSYLAYSTDPVLNNLDPLMLDDRELLDSMIPYTQEALPDWMFAPYPLQEQLMLPAQSPSDSTSTGSGDTFTQGLMDIPDTVPVDPFESNYLRPHRSVSSPCETTSELVPNQIGYQNEVLFHLYDTELCVLPLTSDVALNPFRCRRQTLQASRILSHAIIALCCQHQNHLTGTYSTEATEHRNMATELLERGAQSGQVVRIGLRVLEPILIMFTLDCTISAAGPWSQHLLRVRSILEACGGPPALDNSRVRSQVGMLSWWDATLALISRQGTIIDQPYLEHLMQYQEQDEWSFYDFTGCPDDLFLRLVKLAELARQREFAARMAWLSFDLSPVAEIEREIQHWESSHFSEVVIQDLDMIAEVLQGADPTADVEETLNSKQDRHHCAEAWRYALLIYIERVFRWDRKSHRPSGLTLLVRKTLDHVRSCRRTSQTQKQLLLPVFLAGSETADEEMRRFATEYCQWWATRSRYNMFNSATLLLEEIWEGDHTHAWWGSVIDQKTRHGEAGEAGMQFLLG